MGAATDQGVPEVQSAQVEPIMSTGIGEAATDTGLAQEWPREPDASVKEAQVGKPGRGDTPEGETALLRGSVWTAPDQNDPEGGPASSRGQIGRADMYVGARQVTYGHNLVHRHGSGGR